MEHDRNAQLRCFIKDRREPLVVHPKQISLSIAYAQSKVLPELDPLGAMLHQSFQTIETHLHKVIAFHTRPVHPADGGKALSIGSLEFMDDCDRLIARLHRDVDDAFDATGVHY